MMTTTKTDTMLGRKKKKKAKWAQVRYLQELKCWEILATSVFSVVIYEAFKIYDTFRRIYVFWSEFPEFL